MHQLWGSSFSSKCWKFDVPFGNAEKNCEITFNSRDNCIWIDYSKH